MEKMKKMKKAAGELGGMEVYYELYLGDSEKMTFLQNMAQKYDLLPSVASDRHRAPQPFASTNGMVFYRAMVMKRNRSVD